MLVLPLLAPAANAATRFVTGASIRTNDGGAEISVEFACRMEYLTHLPAYRGKRLRIQLGTTGLCRGAAPSLATDSREQFRPLHADKARLTEIAYDGDTAVGPTLTLEFSEVLRFDVVPGAAGDRLSIRVQFDGADKAAVAAAAPAATRNASQRVRRPEPEQPQYVINLSSSRTPHTATDRMLDIDLTGLSVFETEVELAGATWYRLRVGVFDDAAAANRMLTSLQERYPTAWVDRASGSTAAAVAAAEPAPAAYASSASLAALGLDQVDQLMADARTAVIAGELSRAVQIYTKVLRIPGHDRHAEAQELLGLAREKNGQTAHARTEYQRYLDLYPDGEGTSRVRQRLAALLASARQASAPAASPTPSLQPRRARPSDWRIQTFVSQYYRRDANSFNKESAIVSQSAIYSDVNLDVRRRGERFDFSSRVSAGYRSDLLNEDRGAGNELRVSYAYADLADARTGLRGRIGRQSKNTGGVLGRFDGLSLEYQATERLAVGAVAGLPVFSSSDGLDTERSFLGVNARFGPLIEGLELGAFYIQQDIDGIRDRQAVGTEFRYFGESKSIWGLIDYDTAFQELSSAFLQTSWRISSRLSINASVDRRHSPYLSLGSALVGQPVTSFAALRELMTEAEIRQLSLDRSPVSTSYTTGVSYSLTPKLQINIDGNQTDVAASPASGGVPEVPQSTYRYLSAALVAGSLLTEGDVSMLALRVSDSASTRVNSLTLDTRFPLGERWRINPRLRIDQRRILSDGSDEWLYSPGLRIRYRHSRRMRVEFEAGKQFAQRQTVTDKLDRESLFVNIGYQVFF